MTDGRVCGRYDGHTGKHKSPQAVAKHSVRNYDNERAAARLRYAKDAEWREQRKGRAHPRHLARMDQFRAAGCSKCGTREGELHFHHLDPSTKLFTVSRMTTRSERLFLEEVAKCVVLCEPCHYAAHREMNLSVLRSEASAAPLALMPASSDAEETA